LYRRSIRAPRGTEFLVLIPVPPVIALRRGLLDFIPELVNRVRMQNDCGRCFLTALVCFGCRVLARLDRALSSSHIFDNALAHVNGFISEIDIVTGTASCEDRTNIWNLGEKF
jgi:hypothetical protein